MLPDLDVLLDSHEDLWWAAGALAALLVLRAALRRRRRRPRAGEIWFADVPFEDGTGNPRDPFAQWYAKAARRR